MKYLFGSIVALCFTLICIFLTIDNSKTIEPISATNKTTQTPNLPLTIDSVIVRNNFNFVFKTSDTSIIISDGKSTMLISTYYKAKDIR